MHSGKGGACRTCSAARWARPPRARPSSSATSTASRSSWRSSSRSPRSRSTCDCSDCAPVRRGLAAALTGAATLGALVITTPSAAAPAPRAPTLTVAIPGPFGGCNPGSSTTTAATDEVLSLVLPSAFTPGSLSTPVGDTPVVAQAEVVSLNPQTVVYTIAPGATWPDGTAFSAQDLIRTWQERRVDALVADLGYRDVASMTPNPAGTTLTVVFSSPYSD